MDGFEKTDSSDEVKEVPEKKEKKKEEVAKVRPRGGRRIITRKRHRAYIMIDLQAIMAFAIGLIVGYLLKG